LVGGQCWMRICCSLRQRIEGSFWGRVSFVSNSKTIVDTLQLRRSQQSY
jgi:hypothetical protein